MVELILYSVSPYLCLFAKRSSKLPVPKTKSVCTRYKLRLSAYVTAR